MALIVQQEIQDLSICCADRICRFGDVVKGKMILNEYGQIAQNEWLNTSKNRKNVELDDFVIMPNHMHGIIRLLGLDCKLWQRNYHDHVIRNEQSYQRISDYIINNPVNWVKDKFYYNG